MSVMYCEFCDVYIDTDYDVEHFNENGKCIYVEVGPNYFDGKYATETMEKNGACYQCHVKLKVGHEAIGELDLDGDLSPWSRWCSWDCISDRNDAVNREADRQIKQSKIDRANCKEDPRWPDRKRGR